MDNGYQGVFMDIKEYLWISRSIYSGDFSLCGFIVQEVNYHARGS